MTEDKPKKSIKSIAKTICLLLLAIIASFLIMLSFYISNNRYVPQQCDESIAHSLLQSLQSGALIYEAQEKKNPTVFSDYLISNGNFNKPHTLTLENVKDRLQDIKDINTKELKLVFYPDNFATYYLDNSIPHKPDVTATFSFENEKIPEKKDPFNYYILFFVIIQIILIFIIMSIFGHLSKTIKGKVFIGIILLICFILFSYSTI